MATIKNSHKPTVSPRKSAVKHKIANKKKAISTSATRSRGHEPAPKTTAKNTITVPRWLIVCVLAIIMFFVGAKLLTLARGWQDQRAFDAISADLAKLKDDVILSAGSPYSSTTEQSCSRAHLKFARGPLVCDTSFELKYQPGSVEAANTAVDKINTAIEAKYSVSPISSERILILSESRLPSRVNSKISINSQFDCAVLYDLKHASGNILLEVFLGCSKGSAKEIYSLK
jgi:hypothetical protein